MLARTGSTNDVARALAQSAPAGTTVIADEQSAGRGQHGRRWESAPGTSLLMSVVLRAQPGAGALGAAPLRVGLAVADAIEELTALRPAVKWPNDVLVGGRKIAGILCEGMHAASGSIVIAGIGINVLQQPADFAGELAQHATSLLTATGTAVARADLAGRVLRALDVLADTIGESLTAAELQRFAERDALRGRQITIDGEAAGTAAGISADGALLVEYQGRVRRVHAGTVRVLDAPGVAQQRAR